MKEWLWLLWADSMNQSKRLKSVSDLSNQFELVWCLTDSLNRNSKCFFMWKWTTFQQEINLPKKITVLFLNSLNILLCLNPNIYIKFYTSPCSAKLCHILYLKLLCTIHSYQIDGESETDRATCYVKWRVNVWKRKRSLIDKRMTWKRRQRGVLFKVPDQWTRQQNCYH